MTKNVIIWFLFIYFSTLKIFGERATLLVFIPDTQICIQHHLRSGHLLSCTFFKYIISFKTFFFQHHFSPSYTFTNKGSNTLHIFCFILYSFTQLYTHSSTIYWKDCAWWMGSPSCAQQTQIWPSGAFRLVETQILHNLKNKLHAKNTFFNTCLESKTLSWDLNDA